jgi:predicted dehydrogenase
MALKRRIVVVGLGSIGRRHARLLAQRDDLSVEWCEPSEDSLSRAKQDLKAPDVIHTSFDEMLATRPEMIVVATPHHCHADQACAALEANIHVLCEKPLSDTLETANRIKAAVEKSRAVLTVGFQLHFHPALLRIHEAIRAGTLGSIHHAHCRVGTYVTLVNSQSRYQRDLEGALFLDYAHQPDILFWLLGKEPCGVYAIGGKGGGLPFQSNPNFSSISCDYEEPLISTIHLNYLQSPERHEYEIVGDRGWMLFDLNSGVLRIGRHGIDSPEVICYSPERDGLYQMEHQAFFDAADKLRDPESSAADAIVSMRIVSAALRSLHLRERVEVAMCPA